jgi:uncharacterized surface anchored protein
MFRFTSEHCKREIMNRLLNIGIIVVLYLIGTDLLLVSCEYSVKTLTSPTTLQTQTTSSLIPVDKAITIASAWVPPDVLSQADISYTTQPLGTNDPIGWVIMFNFNTVQVTAEQLLKFGWVANSNTTFSPPDWSYPLIIITVNANTGEIMDKSATDYPYLGMPPTT